MKNFISSLLLFGVFGVFLYGIMKAAIIIYNADIKIIVAIIASLSAVLGAFFTQYFIKKREEQNAHRDKKIEIYNEFIDIAQRMVASKNENLNIKKVTDEELQDFFFRFNRDIILWGSPGVIKTFLEFKNASHNSIKGKELLVLINNLYKEFRKDIGLSNWGLNSNELIKINLSDPEELDKL